MTARSDPSLSGSTMTLLEEAILYFNAHHDREQECYDALTELGLTDAALSINVPDRPAPSDAEDHYPREWDRRNEPYNKR